jgi:hypothetical protein
LHPSAEEFAMVTQKKPFEAPMLKEEASLVDGTLDSICSGCEPPPVNPF